MLRGRERVRTNEEELFDQYDTDNNYLVSLAELEAQPESRFLEMDEDEDCIVSEKELIKILTARSVTGARRQRGSGGQDGGGGRRRRN